MRPWLCIVPVRKSEYEGQQDLSQDFCSGAVFHLADLVRHDGGSISYPCEKLYVGDSRICLRIYACDPSCAVLISSDETVALYRYDLYR